MNRKENFLRVIKKIVMVAKKVAFVVIIIAEVSMFLYGCSFPLADSNGVANRYHLPDYRQQYPQCYPDLSNYAGQEQQKQFDYEKMLDCMRANNAPEYTQVYNEYRAKKQYCDIMNAISVGALFAFIVTLFAAMKWW